MEVRIEIIIDNFDRDLSPQQLREIDAQASIACSNLEMLARDGYLGYKLYVDGKPTLVNQ